VIIKKFKYINQLTPVGDRDYVHKEDTLLKYLKADTFFTLGTFLPSHNSIYLHDFSFQVNVKQTFTTPKELGKFIALLCKHQGITFSLSCFYRAGSLTNLV